MRQPGVRGFSRKGGPFIAHNCEYYIHIWYFVNSTGNTAQHWQLVAFERVRGMRHIIMSVYKAKKRSRRHVLMRDLLLIGVSIAFAIALMQSDLVARAFNSTLGTGLLGSFVAGIFFTSVFTIAPASAALAILASAGNPIAVAVVGAAGALLGDLILFFVLRDGVKKDFDYLIGHKGLMRLHAIGRIRVVRFLTPLFGALVIASPLPDELGLAMMGLLNTRTSILIPISYSMNFLGILGLTAVVRLLVA